MAVYLLDTNVLLALLWPQHIHYQSARNWFSGLGQNQWSTCPITECGFVRISANAKAMPTKLTPSAAIELLKHLVHHPRYVFWEDHVSFVTSPQIPKDRIRGHQQVTDAYLLSLAISRGGKLATFDQAVPALASNQYERDAVFLIPT